jgi:3-dehydroquinate dehydratase-2
MRIAIINGPNLNLLGTREPEVYGSQTLGEIEDLVRDAASGLNVETRFAQSNIEGEIIDAIHAAHLEWNADAVIINPGGYSHTSIAIRDAIASVPVPVIEVHLSNTQAREEFRRMSIVGSACHGRIEGLGYRGYILALEYLAAVSTTT